MFLFWLRQLPRCGDRTPVSVPPPAEGRSSPTNTPVFPPRSLFYQVLRGSIYSFPLVRHSCPLSGGVLHELLCLKVYSWCIHGERCTPRPPTSLPSCSLFYYFWWDWFVSFCNFLSISCLGGISVYYLVLLLIHIRNNSSLNKVELSVFLTYIVGQRKLKSAHQTEKASWDQKMRQTVPWSQWISLSK